jgi:plasmid stabilization system protein ParE
LAHIVDYIRKDNPATARRVAQTVYQGVAALRNFPYRGRIGLAEDTRELVFAPLPYIAVYENRGRSGAGASNPPRCSGLAVKVTLHHAAGVFQKVAPCVVP